MTAPRAFPVPDPNGDDERFTFGLALEVAKVLVRHGYPASTGDDLVELRQALFRFVYRGDDR